MQTKKRTRQKNATKLPETKNRLQSGHEAHNKAMHFLRQQELRQENYLWLGAGANILLKKTCTGASPENRNHLELKIIALTLVSCSNQHSTTSPAILIVTHMKKIRKEKGGSGSSAVTARVKNVGEGGIGP